MRSPRPAPLPDAAEHRTLKLRDEVHRHAGPVYRSVDCAKQNPLGSGIPWMTSELAQIFAFSQHSARQTRRADGCDCVFVKPYKGHVWTAPWQGLSDVFLQHWSGAVTCPACWCGKCGRWP
jgi:hypothetical protein